LKPGAPSKGARTARFVAIAFESGSLAESVCELDRHGIPHGPVVPYVEIAPDGKKMKLYANVILGKMLGGSFWIDYMIFMGRLPGSRAMANPGAGGAPKQSNNFTSNFIDVFDVSRDGKRFAINRSTGNDDIVLIKDFR
jgi:hypothetical protein